MSWLWRLATVLLVALLTGLAFAHVLERPAKLAHDGPLYLTLQQTLYVQWGPPNVGGFLEPAAITTTLVLAFLLRRDRRGVGLTAVAGILLLAAFPGVFFWLVAPANEVFRGATATSLPANWMAMRDAWETGHAIRFVLQFGALAVLVSSLVLDTRGTAR